MKLNIWRWLFLSLMLFSSAAFAEEAVSPFRKTELPLPRFASLASDKVYARSGPALRYPIKWVYRRDGMPVEIVQEFDSWRKIKDVDGEGGWVHQSLLSGTRTILIKGDSPLTVRSDDRQDSRMIVRLEPGVQARLDKCKPGWCRISIGGYNGWAERKFLWGIYGNEELN